MTELITCCECGEVMEANEPCCVGKDGSSKYMCAECQATIAGGK